MMRKSTRRTRGLPVPCFYWGYLGIMENKMEATIVHRGYIEMMEKKTSTIKVYRGCILLVGIALDVCVSQVQVHFVLP